MRYLYLLLIVVIVSILGYYTGQYFYKQKINTTQSTSKPLILPLIEEKKHAENIPDSQPLIIIPTTTESNTLNKDNKTTPNEYKKNTTKKEFNMQTTTQTAIQTTTQIKEDEKTELPENTYLAENTNKPQNEEKNETNDNEPLESNSGLYYIQVGSFSSLENAQSVKKQLESLGLNPKIEQIISGNTVIYRVIIGNYKTQEEAIEESNKLKRIGFDNIVKNY